jgi:hypothetical protein
MFVVCDADEKGVEGELGADVDVDEVYEEEHESGKEL